LASKCENLLKLFSLKETFMSEVKSDVKAGEVVHVGVKETTELLKAVDAFIILLGQKLKDGFQLQDVLDILQAFAKDPVYMDAVKGIKEVVPEFKDLDVQEGVSLAMVLLWGLPKYIEAFKKGQPVA
jgi:hypothetical protein